MRALLRDLKQAIPKAYNRYLSRVRSFLPSVGWKLSDAGTWTMGEIEVTSEQALKLTLQQTPDHPAISEIHRSREELNVAVKNYVTSAPALLQQLGWGRDRQNRFVSPSPEITFSNLDSAVAHEVYP